MKKKVKRKTIRKIVVGIIILGFIVFIIGNKMGDNSLKIVGEIVILSSLIPVYLFWRCPYCGRFLRRIYMGCCPHCGRLLDDED